MAKSLSAEMTAIEAEERRLAERRKAHEAKVREAAISSIEKAGLLKLPLDRLEGLMKVVKTLGVEETERRLQATTCPGKPSVPPVAASGFDAPARPFF